MEDTLNYLYPHMPRLLESGMSRAQTMPLLSLRSSAMKVWKIFSGDVQHETALDEVFGSTCKGFDEPDCYALDVFRDEFIGQLVKALPHPSLNYDRWLIELDPREQKRREQFGEPPPLPSLTPPPERSTGRERADPDVTILPADTSSSKQPTGLRSGTLTSSGRPEPAPDLTFSTSLPDAASVTAGSEARREVQNDLFGGRPVISGDNENITKENVSLSSPEFGAGSLVSAFTDPEEESSAEVLSSVAFAATGLEPVSDIWHISALQDDTEHLQDMAYRLVFEIAEAMGCTDCVREDKNPLSAGFAVSDSAGEFKLFLAGISGSLPNTQFNMFMFFLNFFGSPVPSDTAVFDDITVVKTMRLIRVIRRLRELQRLVAQGG